MYIASGAAVLINCVFAGNQRRSTVGVANGGAIWSEGTPTLVNCAFFGNEADGGACDTQC